MKKIIFVMLILSVFVQANAEEKYMNFVVDMTKLPDVARVIVFDNLILKGFQNRGQKIHHPAQVTHYIFNRDKSYSIVQGMFNDDERGFFNLPYVSSKTTEELHDFMRSDEWRIYTSTGQ